MNDINTEIKDNYPDKVSESFEFIVSKGVKPVRIDQFLTHKIHNATRTKVQKAIDADCVKLNGKITKASKKINPGDKIHCTIYRFPPMELIPENIPLDIIYEDNYLLVVNKPAGMVTHPGLGNRYGTLVNALIYHLGQRDSIQVDIDEDDDNLSINTNQGAIFASDQVRPGIVHRLDKDTSGLLVVAKKPEVHTMLSEQFLDRTISREYNTIIWGKRKERNGTIEGDIGRSPRYRMQYAVLNKGGKSAITDYWTIDEYEFTTLLKVKLRTGRTHQIRVHFSHTNNPVFGDKTYGGDTVVFGGGSPKKKKIALQCLRIANRQMLHAASLEFYHPILKNRMSFEAPLPEDMKKVLTILSQSNDNN